MTKKRFTMDYEPMYDEVIYFDNDDVMTDTEVLNKLNEFNESVEIISELRKENNELKKQIETLSHRLVELNDLQWIRENTVWEQMPTRCRIYTTTNFKGDFDE